MKERNEKLKRVLAAVLTVGMLAGSLVGCGSTPAESSTGGSGDADTGAETDGGDTADAGSGELKKLSIFIDHTWYPVDSFTGIIPEEIKKRTGIDLDVTVAVDDSQLGVMIASGELPDLVYTQRLLDRLSDDNVCYSYEDLIEEYNVDWEIPAKQLGIARGYSKDGKAYTVLNLYSDKSDWEKTSATPMVGSMAYRKDIYDAIGSPEINNLDDMFSVMGTVKEKYPDMVPLQLNENWNTEVFRDLLGMGALKYIEQEDGSYIHYSEDPRYKDMLMWLNKCYLNGYIVPDDKYFVSGSTAIATDKYFFSCICTQNGLANADLSAIDPSYVLYEMKPFDTASYAQSNLGWSGVFISKNNKDPEASIKFIQQMFTPEMQKLSQMGREGIDYTLNEEGLPEFSEDWKKASEANTLKVDYNNWFYLGGSAIVEAEGRVAVYKPEWVADAYPEINKRYDNLPWIEAARPLGESDEKIIEDKIVELVKVYEQKIILANSQDEAAALYDEYIKNAGTTGIEKLDAYMTDKIAEIMPLYQ